MNLENPIDELETKIRELDKSLRPIGNRPVDITKPGWVDKLKQSDPLGEAGIRPQAQAALIAAIRLYETAPPDDRKRLRGLFTAYSMFALAATLPDCPLTQQSLRDHLLHYSLVDQGPDSRDAILLLRYLCDQARKAGIDARPILDEVAALSSDVDKYGMGSTRKQLTAAGC